MKFMSRTILALVAVLLAGVTTAEAQQASIVFLNTEQLRREAPSLQAARERLEQEMSALEAQADSALAPMDEELQGMMMEFQQQQGMMTAEQREERATQLAQRRQALAQAGAEWERRAAELQGEILGPVLQRINQVIAEIREENDYAYVLDVAAGGVVAADPSLDITSEVLRRLRVTANQGQ